VTAAVDALGGACASAERRFHIIGQRLEAALGVLGRMRDSFAALQAEWTAADLAGAAHDLGRCIAQVGAVTALHLQGDTALDRLLAVAGSIPAHAAQMRGPAGQIDFLAVNARLTAATIGHAGEAFDEFAQQIRRLAKQVQARLTTLDRSLANLREEVQSAHGEHGGFSATKVAEIQALPKSLGSALAAAEAYGERASPAIATVQERLATIHQDVVAAVAAMQLGDITRQRVEHTQSIAGLVTREPDDLAGLGWRIAAAQLRDTAEQLDGEAAHIHTALQDLAVQAQAIARLGSATFGAGAGSCLGELQGEVRHTCEALATLHASCAAADASVETVQSAAGQLAGQITALSEMETDIRLMGLNTSLRSSRLGAIGQPLTVIAQMLRACGRQIMGAADAVRDGLAVIVLESRRLTDPRRKQAVAAIGLLQQEMTAAIERLAQADRALVAALGVLHSDSKALTGLLGEALAEFTVSDEICVVLLRIAAQMENWAEQVPQASAGTARTRLLETIAEHYTMARERFIHASVTDPTAVIAAPSEQGELEAMLL
jgi:uncharacterized protein YukE